MANDHTERAGKPVDLRPLLERYLDNPAAQRAYADDAMYHASITILRRVLEAVDGAMRTEEIPEEVRERVIRLALYGGGPNVHEAHRRMVDFAERVARLEANPRDLYRLPVPAFGPGHLPGDDQTGGRL